MPNAVYIVLSWVLFTKYLKYIMLIKYKIANSNYDSPTNQIKIKYFLYQLKVNGL